MNTDFDRPNFADGNSPIEATLLSFRSDVEPMTAASYASARPRRTDAPRRYRVLAAAASVAVVAGAFGAVQLVDGGPAPVAAASTVLARAADFAASAEPLDTSVNTWIYREDVRQNGPVRLVIRNWEKVDGTAPTRSDYSPAAPSGATTEVTPPSANPATAPLATRSYASLRDLPDDPDALLGRLRADPDVAFDISRNGVSADVALWEQIRLLAARMPVERQATLFRAAEKVAGLTVTGGVADAADRPGTALGLIDPRLGDVQLIFSDIDGRYLGERILNTSNGSTQFSSAVVDTETTADTGMIPAGR